MKKEKTIEILKAILEDWDTNEDSMGEQAALNVACEMNGKTVDWFNDNAHLLNER